MAHAVGRLGRVKCGDEVAHLGVVGQGLEAVGEALGHVELAVVLCAQLEALPAPIGR